MGRGRDLTSLYQLDDDVLEEVVREGEIMLAAQFAAATASDQRATAWAGLIITLATASVGATATLIMSARDISLAVVTGLLSILLSISAFSAIRSFRPSLFSLPGNRPECWLPFEWGQRYGHGLKAARIDQATCLNNQIDDNAKQAMESAKALRHSMDLASISIALASVYTIAFGAFWMV